MQVGTRHAVTSVKRILRQTIISKRINYFPAAKESCKHPAAIRSSPAPSAQEYVNPELGSSVIRGHAAPSMDFLPTDLRTTKNLPLHAKENFPFE